jgi:hypothetical protein
MRDSLTFRAWRTTAPRPGQDGPRTTINRIMTFILQLFVPAAGDRSERTVDREKERKARGWLQALIEKITRDFFQPTHV